MKCKKDKWRTINLQKIWVAHVKKITLYVKSLLCLFNNLRYVVNNILITLLEVLILLDMTFLINIHSSSLSLSAVTCHLCPLSMVINYNYKWCNSYCHLFHALKQIIFSRQYVLEATFTIIKCQWFWTLTHVKKCWITPKHCWVLLYLIFNILRLFFQNNFLSRA